MKKFLTVLLDVLLILGVVGCGNDKTVKNDDSPFYSDVGSNADNSVGNETQSEDMQSEPSKNISNSTVMITSSYSGEEAVKNEYKAIFSEYVEGQNNNKNDAENFGYSEKNNENVSSGSITVSQPTADYNQSSSSSSSCIDYNDDSAWGKPIPIPEN